MLLLLLARPFLVAVLAELPSSRSKPVKRRPISAFSWAGAAAVVQSLTCCLLSRPLHILTPLYWLTRLLQLLWLLLTLLFQLLRSALVRVACQPVESQALAAAHAAGSPA
jgi:hypothetical protein